MQLQYLTLLALAAAATAQFSDLTEGIANGIKSKVNSEVQDLIPTVTYSGPGANILSSARASVTDAVASKIGVTPAATTSGASATGAVVTSTGAANVNQVAQIGVGAAVVAGFWGMVV